MRRDDDVLRERNERERDRASFAKLRARILHDRERARIAERDALRFAAVVDDGWMAAFEGLFA